MRTVYLGTSPFAAAVLRRARGLPAPPGARRHPPRPPARPRAPARRAAGRRDRPRARARARPARVGQRRRGRARIAAAAPEALVRVRLRRADQGAAAVRLPDAQRAPVAAAALARGGADRAGDHGRRRPHRGLHHAPDRRPRHRSGLPAGAEPIAPEDTYGTLAERLQTLGGELLVRGARRRPRAAFDEQDEARGHLRREDHRRGPAARPGRAPPPTLERAGARAHAAHRRGGRAARRRRAARRAGERTPGRRRAGDPRAGRARARRRACRCSAARRGALELDVVQPRRGRAMDAATRTCAAARG